MLKLLSGIFRKKTTQQLAEWRTHDSVYEAICQAVLPAGRLPEDFKVAVSPDPYSAMCENRIRDLARKLKDVAETGNKTAAAEFYDIAVSLPQVIGVIDAFLDEMGNYSLPIEPHLFSFAYDLAFCTNQLNSVKFGIAILGLCQNRVVVDKLKVLAAYEKFTVYVTIAIMNLCDDPEEDLYDIGKTVRGWGKIQLTYRLARICRTDAVKNWLLLDGFKNSIDNHFLAGTCAQYGGLHKKLRSAAIDKYFFDAATELLENMLEGQRVMVTEYKDVPEAIEHYMRHADEHASSLRDFLLLNSIQSYLESQLIDQNRNSKWTDSRIAGCLMVNDTLLKDNCWKELVQKVLSNPEDVQYPYAQKAAVLLLS